MSNKLDHILMLTSAAIVIGSFVSFSFLIIREQVRDYKQRKVLGKCCHSDHCDKWLDDPYPVSKKYKKDHAMTNREKAKEYSNRRKRKDGND